MGLGCMRKKAEQTLEMKPSEEKGEKEKEEREEEEEEGKEVCARFSCCTPDIYPEGR